VAFVGQETYFRITSLTSETEEIAPRFIDFRAGADAEQMLSFVTAFSPDAVVAFRPEIVPPGLFATLRVPVLGFLTEPLPRATADSHPDLQARLAQSLALDPLNFYRIVSFDPLFVEAAESLAPVWRSVPLPVDDSCFSPVRSSAVPPRVVFVGRSTKHRERYLVPVKHRFDILHVAHGVHGERLLELFRSTDVGINLHNEPYPSFENRVCLHLAAGHLVISEPLSPSHGLEPGIDYIESTARRLLTSRLISAIAFRTCTTGCGCEADRRRKRSGPPGYTHESFTTCSWTWTLSVRSGRFA
jgi:hypothetical protein